MAAAKRAVSLLADFLRRTAWQRAVDVGGEEVVRTSKLLQQRTCDGWSRENAWDMSRTNPQEGRDGG